MRHFARAPSKYSTVQKSAVPINPACADDGQNVLATPPNTTTITTTTRLLYFRSAPHRWWVGFVHEERIISISTTFFPSLHLHLHRNSTQNPVTSTIANKTFQTELEGSLVKTSNHITRERVVPGQLTTASLTTYLAS